jgi:hypothetical protein
VGSETISGLVCSYSWDGRRIISAEGSKGFIAVWDKHGDFI